MLDSILSIYVMGKKATDIQTPYTFNISQRFNKPELKINNESK